MAYGIGFPSPGNRVPHRETYRCVACIFPAVSPFRHFIHYKTRLICKVLRSAIRISSGRIAVQPQLSRIRWWSCGNLASEVMNLVLDLGATMRHFRSTKVFLLQVCKLQRQPHTTL
ncbi:hypothetical protein DQ04_18741000 [Trypanosoma grayi]|uniref:hypothetical protein n=1 Tax=Trypanosoma grayi TaxID=71804 RepID=UPI0004F4448F|nr:hypothetical protein DQ04_18741000 [Trypanosoma grayi]KEG05750.1 hypothetical protein DQ04_18741000 [Trypanosoma grayi]